MLVLGIESSCDETAAAIVRDGREMVSSVISSQVEIHSRFGVVVPELASREHLDKIVPVVEEAFARDGDPRAVRFSVPRMGDGRPDFSFSGLKTAVSKHVRETGLKPVAPGEEPSQAVKDLAASFQDMVIRSLVGTTENWPRSTGRARSSSRAASPATGLCARRPPPRTSPLQL